MRLKDLGALGVLLSACASETASTPPANTASGGSSVAGAPTVGGGAANTAGGGASSAGSAPIAGGAGGNASAGAGAGGAALGGAGAGAGAGGGPGAGGGGSGGSGGTGDFDTPLEECATPSIDRFQQWLASGEGTTVPASGSVLQAEGDTYVARIEFVTDWCVGAIWIMNAFGEEADFSGSAGFQLDYSATSSFYIQLRPGGADYSGGDQWAIQIPSTGGQRMKAVFSFDGAQWASIFGPPSLTFEQTLSRASGFVFVGNTANQLAFYGMRVDGFVPECR